MTAPAPLGFFVGNTTIDVQYRVRAVPSPDTGVEADDVVIAPGGPSYNAAVAFSSLGGRAVCASAAGGSPLAPLVHADAAAFGVVFRDCASRASRLAVSTILTDDEARRTIISSDLGAVADAALLQLPAETPAIIAWDGFHPALFDAVTAAYPATRVLLDGGRWLPALAGRLGRITWAVVSERFRVPGAPGDPAGTIAALRAAGCAGAAVTRGERPVLVDAGDGSIRKIVPPAADTVLDTLGAGDILHGALALALAHGEELREALVRACAEATASCAHFGTRGWLRERFREARR